MQKKIEEWIEEYEMNIVLTIGIFFTVLYFIFRAGWTAIFPMITVLILISIMMID